jgi:membrane protein YqaA with SNARE-associated domain
MNTRLYHYRGILSIGIFVALLFVLFFFINPQELVESLGVTNSYIILFFVALIGGTSSLTSSSYYATIIAFAISGLNPFIMALVAGVGLSIGDAIFYLLGIWGRNNISGRAKHLVEKGSRWLLRKPKWLVQIIVYLYTGFTPFPGDVLMVTLSFARFPYKSFVIAGLLGNITLVLVVALGVVWGSGLVQ